MVVLSGTCSEKKKYGCLLELPAQVRKSESESPRRWRRKWGKGTWGPASEGALLWEPRSCGPDSLRLCCSRSSSFALWFRDSCSRLDFGNKKHTRVWGKVRDKLLWFVLVPGNKKHTRVWGKVRDKLIWFVLVPQYWCFFVSLWNQDRDLSQEWEWE